MVWTKRSRAAHGSLAAPSADLRGAMAYRIGHIPSAINIRDDHLTDMLHHGIPFPPTTRIVFVCPIGELSRRYAARLTRAGHPAASLTGGITAWRDAGHPLDRATRPDQPQR